MIQKWRMSNYVELFSKHLRPNPSIPRCSDFEDWKHERPSQSMSSHDFLAPNHPLVLLDAKGMLLSSPSGRNTRLWGKKVKAPKKFKSLPKQWRTVHEMLTSSILRRVELSIWQMSLDLQCSFLGRIVNRSHIALRRGIRKASHTRATADKSCWKEVRMTATCIRSGNSGKACSLLLFDLMTFCIFRIACFSRLCVYFLYVHGCLAPWPVWPCKPRISNIKMISYYILKYDIIWYLRML